ncbi:ABC transporter permease [Vibrio sp. SS-MA-C1-2]|uniref:ABC transporter permease n=1 Tax=Vibrio sp. SS-MA-C1-2 TaxID=2908646 RepID=UPI001F21F246|nr:ABC transporter permease [Vibrio sp. SS-MA-C1-2]UJF18154.1 ABC transporter permease [Vibrio sp. SS-MA-C1-2]
MSIMDTTKEAINLLFSGDHDLWSIVAVSFSVSLLSIALVLIPGTLLGFLLARFKFFGHTILLTLVTTLQSVPTVVIGLLLYMLLSRSGPLGDWHWLFTQKAMIFGQMLISFPIIVSMSHAVFQNSDQRVWETAKTLGASNIQALKKLLWEYRFPLLAAVIFAFSRIITEVGSSMMVGGNLLGSTRNIPTAIALESQKGSFAQGVALGIVLLILALVLNLVLSIARGKGYLKSN